VTATWERLRDSKGYKVYRTERFELLRYTVATPSGSVLTCTFTLWGARRAIRRDKRRGPDGRWWEQPIAYEEGR